MDTSLDPPLVRDLVRFASHLVHHARRNNYSGGREETPCIACSHGWDGLGWAGRGWVHVSGDALVTRLQDWVTFPSSLPALSSSIWPGALPSSSGCLVLPAWSGSATASRLACSRPCLRSAVSARPRSTPHQRPVRRCRP